MCPSTKSRLLEAANSDNAKLIIGRISFEMTYLIRTEQLSVMYRESA